MGPEEKEESEIIPVEEDHAQKKDHESKLTKLARSLSFNKKDVPEESEKEEEPKEETEAMTEPSKESTMSKFMKNVPFAKKETHKDPPTETDTMEQSKEEPESVQTSIGASIESTKLKIMKTVPFAKKETKEEEKETENEKEKEKEKTSSGVMSMKQLTEFLSMKSEPTKEVTLDDTHDVDNGEGKDMKDQPVGNTNATSSATDSEKQAKEDEQPVAKRESRLTVKFKEIKEKTVTEVTKIARGRSVQRGERIRRDDESDCSNSNRTRSESRSQKAGRLVKDFTTNILKKR